MKGFVNTRGATSGELQAVLTVANGAKTAATTAQSSADAALEAITELTSTINAVPSQNGTLNYTGGEQAPAWNCYDSTKLIIGGETSATEAGTHYATFAPEDGFKWSDGTTEAKTVAWTITRATIAVPTVSSNPTYTGSTVSPEWSGYDSAKMTISGVTSGITAGNHIAIFTPGDNYQWPDGSTTDKTVTWRINKAAGSMSISPTSMTLDISTLSSTITVTRAGNGSITATSSDTSVATVIVKDKIVTVTAKAKGSATITVSVGEGTNYTAPSSKTCAVTVNLPSTTLADNDPSMIQAAAKAGTASSYWSVGDKIGIELSGTVGSLSLSGTYYAFIIGFNHNEILEGPNSIHFQFGKTEDGTDIAFVDADSVYSEEGNTAGFRMNINTNMNTGGWADSYMRNTICPAFLAAMPEEWQNVIAACTKYSDNTGGGSDTASYVTATQDKIWPLAEFEVLGVRQGANSAEQNYQVQYDYYANGNSKIKYEHSNTASSAAWWFRSVGATVKYYFYYMNSGGTAVMGGFTDCSLGFAPGFKVA